MEGIVALVVWLVIALVLVGLEMATLAFIALYLAVGAVAAAITGAVGGNLLVQVLVFALVSVASLVFTRRSLMKALNRTPLVVSNAQTVVGKRALVTVPIEEGPGHRGQVRIGTEFWSALSTDEQALDEGTTVEVVGIEGVAAIVRRVEPAPAV